MFSWTSNNALANSIGYDSHLQPTSISVTNVESVALTYDAANRITHITKGMDATLTQALTYDAVSRPTEPRYGRQKELQLRRWRQPHPLVTALTG